MELKTELNILREHSTYLTTLTTEISSLLATAEASLEGQQGDTLPGAKQIADVLRLFSQEADVFCTRIKTFLETHQHIDSTQKTNEIA